MKIIIKHTIFQKAIVLIILFNFSFLSFGQKLKEPESFAFENERVDELKSFVCKKFDGKVYITWTVLKSPDECLYQLERSTDGKIYNTIYFGNEEKSPLQIELQNSFIDENPLNSISYYRLKRLIKGESIVSSPFVLK